MVTLSQCQELDFPELLEIDLPDNPCLKIQGNPVQNSHINCEILLRFPEWRTSRWRYLYTTNEWIPVFKLIQGDIEKMVNIETDIHDNRALWITPKHYPRGQ